ncbi:MAG TPA: MFS transporter [Deltaproteobacteria bacterium]|nr:MFS transporter [Deltaproteobacteria bacterium]HPR54622.1 MFS transporter [Deltaproteobacteria bacterium]HXK47246.1 MFS transporter [Deltaproteobacteria bacterium]
MARVSREYLVLLGAHFFFFLNFSELILLPKYFLTLGLGPSAIGLLMGAFSLSVLASLPVAGYLSEKVRRKRLFMAGTVLMAVPTALYGVSSNYLPALFLLRILQGIGFSSAFGIIGAMVTEAGAPGQRKLLLGILTVAGIMTHAIGPTLGEFLVGSWGYSALFASASAFGFIALLLSFLLPVRASGGWTGLAGVNPAPALAAASLVLGAIFGSAIVFLPPFLMTRGITDSSPFFISFVFGSMLVWTVLYAKIRALPGRVSWTASSVLLVLLLLCIPWADRGLAFIALSLLFGVGYGYLYPTLNASMIAANPAHQGIANALFVWSFNVGMLVASVGFGFLCEVIGYVAAFQMVGAVGICLMIGMGLHKHDVLYYHHL